jgi:putative ABC transport system ATP-binding protein
VTDHDAAPYSRGWVREHAIATDDLAREFRVGDSIVHALRGVRLRVPAGTLTVVRGRSGAGKTTLLNLVGGLDRPTAGNVSVAGQPVSELDERALVAFRRATVGHVFQTFGLLPILSAAENVEVPLRLERVDGTVREERVAELLELVGLGARARHRPAELSGGEQQRVAIARALINDPAIILADGPTGNLDSKSGAELMDIFRQLHTQGMTIVMVTHDPEVSQQCKRIVRIRDGQITADERTEVLQ